MQHTTKMVMVPQDAYTNLVSKQKQMYSPVVNQLSNLDQELQTIVTNPNLSSEVKYHQYMNIFKRYQTLRNYNQETTAAPVLPDEPQLHEQVVEEQPEQPISVTVERRLLDGLPKQVRRKGKLLIDHVKANPERFKFLKSGELVAQGEAIPGSNITDLFHYSTRNRTTVEAPPGFEEFEELLMESNVPREATGINDPPHQIMSPSKAAVKKKQERKELYKSTPAVGRPVREKRKPARYGTWESY